jgi:hypothetical protein
MTGSESAALVAFSIVGGSLLLVMRLRLAWSRWGPWVSARLKRRRGRWPRRT